MGVIENMQNLILNWNKNMNSMPVHLFNVKVTETKPWLKSTVANTKSTANIGIQAHYLPIYTLTCAFRALALLVGHQEEHPACKN